MQSSGEWSGLVGDLVSGRLDIVVAPMTMTSEREEVVDFVAPYFDQSGISIIHRKVGTYNTQISPTASLSGVLRS